MNIPRRTFFKQAVVVGAVAAPLLEARAARPAVSGSAGRDSSLMVEAKFVDVDGIRTRYFDAGTGEALVLIHGGQWPSTASADGWRPIFDHLPKHFHVYAFDKLGMGFTDNPKNDTDYSMDAVIRHAYAFTQEVGVRKAVIVGHSRGGLVAARIAVDHPELISHLIILDSNTLAPDDPNTPPRQDPDPIETPPAKEEIRNSLMKGNICYHKEFITDEYVEAEARIAQLPKLREVDRKFRELRDRWNRENLDMVKRNPSMGRNMGATTWWMYRAKYETLDRIKAGQLKVPTLIVWGFNDATAPYFLGVNLMETVSKVVDRAELHIINHSGHLVFAEYPAEVTALIARFATGSE